MKDTKYDNMTGTLNNQISGLMMEILGQIRVDTKKDGVNYPIEVENTNGRKLYVEEKYEELHKSIVNFRELFCYDQETEKYRDKIICGKRNGLDIAILIPLKINGYSAMPDRLKQIQEAFKVVEANFNKIEFDDPSKKSLIQDKIENYKKNIMTDDVQQTINNKAAELERTKIQNGSENQDILNDPKANVDIQTTVSKPKKKKSIIKSIRKFKIKKQNEEEWKETKKKIGKIALKGLIAVAGVAIAVAIFNSILGSIAFAGHAISTGAAINATPLIIPLLSLGGTVLTLGTIIGGIKWFSKKKKQKTEQETETTERVEEQSQEEEQTQEQTQTQQQVQQQVATQNQGQPLTTQEALLQLKAQIQKVKDAKNNLEIVQQQVGTDPTAAQDAVLQEHNQLFEMLIANISDENLQSFEQTQQSAGMSL